MIDDLVLRYPDSNMFHLPPNVIPICMGKNQVDEIQWAEEQYCRPVRCWEDQIIDKVNANEEGLFDFSKNILDIGAGIGEYCWDTHFNHAWAFEPNRKDAALIYMNAYLRDRVYDIDIIVKGCSDHAFEVDYNGWTLTEGCGRADAKVTPTEFIRIDDMNLQNIGFIKIDIEGYELEALQGAINTIYRNNYPPILIEIWTEGCPYWDNIEPDGSAKRDRLIEFLEQNLGYQIIWNWGDWETHLCVHE